MKILLAYDGSKSADAALDDLRRAGLPRDGVETLILSVAEIWMPPPTNGDGPGEYLSEVAADWIERHRRVKQAARHEAESLSRHALENLQTKFPGWKIRAETSAGSPAQKILEKAGEFCPDLIVLGAQGKNAVSRLFLGSIAGKILAEAKCPVRVSRAGSPDVAAQSPVRLIIGFDGSPGAEAAVEAVIARKWNENSEILMVTAIDSIVPDSIGRFMTSSIIWVEEEIQTERGWIEKIAHRALLKLAAAGLRTNLCVRSGNPKQILTDEALKWNADCIFVGAHSLQNAPDPFPLGTLSAAVAERADCSVEIVRKKIQ
jgi:nucleotide-binding universal stress UspA family protein